MKNIFYFFYSGSVHVKLKQSNKKLNQTPLNWEINFYSGLSDHVQERTSSVSLKYWSITQTAFSFWSCQCRPKRSTVTHKLSQSPLNLRKHNFFPSLSNYVQECASLISPKHWPVTRKAFSFWFDPCKTWTIIHKLSQTPQNSLRKHVFYSSLSEVAVTINLTYF